MPRFFKTTPMADPVPRSRPGMFPEVRTFSEPLPCPACGGLSTMVMASGSAGEVHAVGGCLDCGHIWEGSCRVAEIALRVDDGALHARVTLAVPTTGGSDGV